MTSPTVLNSGNFITYSTKATGNITPVNNSARTPGVVRDLKNFNNKTDFLGTINSANSTLSTPIGNNNQNIGMFQPSSSHANNKNIDSKTIKLHKENFNNIYKVRHLLEE